MTVYTRRMTTQSPRDYRLHRRVAVEGLELRLGGRSYEILDYSSGGARIRAGLLSGDLPRVAVVEVVRGERVLCACAAVKAWSRNGEAGYEFRKSQKIDIGAPRDPRPRASAGSAIRARLNL